MAKPATRYFAKPHYIDGLLYGQFAMPGIVPMLVGEHKGEPRTFRTEEDAYSAACRGLVEIMQARSVNTSKAGGYARMTPAEFGEALGTVNITATYFAEIYGVPYLRVMKWLDGEQDIPHAVRMVLIGMGDDKCFAEMEAETRKALEQGK